LTHLEVHGSSSVKTYSVAGGSLEKIRESMRELTPNKDGHPSFTTYSWQSVGGREGKLVTYGVLTTLPEWDGRGASDEDALEWKRYSQAARIHENGHETVILAAFDRLRELGDDRHIDALIGKDGLADTETIEYDSATDDGASQGARLGSSVEPEDASALISSMVKVIAAYPK
jgi:hypothetical protein